jgi:hypothetical protein
MFAWMIENSLDPVIMKYPWARRDSVAVIEGVGIEPPPGKNVGMLSYIIFSAACIERERWEGARGAVA